MQGDSRHIDAALKVGLKLEDFPNTTFLHSAKGPDHLITTKDSLQE